MSQHFSVVSQVILLVQSCEWLDHDILMEIRRCVSNFLHDWQELLNINFF